MRRAASISAAWTARAIAAGASLPALREAPGRGGAKRYGFGVYEAQDYDELIDHPVEMGDFALASFKAGGAQHDVVFTGVLPNLTSNGSAATCVRSARRR